jgi:hypothetical protein
MQLTININTEAGTATVEQEPADKPAVRFTSIERETQKQMFGLFQVLFGTTERKVRHAFTRTVLGHDDLPASWAFLTQPEALQVLRALEATCEVDTLLGERFAAVQRIG